MITAILAVVLFGMLGLVIDAGQLMSAHRMTRNAADAAATAAAMDLMNGRSQAQATATATIFVKDYNGLASATVTVNIPPASGPHAGNSRYVEVFVSQSVPTTFIQILDVSSTQIVKGRAVGGYEGGGNNAVVMMLNPDARPGFYADGSAYLKVNGAVMVNSNGGGQKENGQPINNGNSGSAITLTGNAKLYATDVQSAGGLIKTGSASVEKYPYGGSPNPLHTGVATAPDPFINLPSPTTANGAVGTTYPAVLLNAVQNVTLSPGVYPSIELQASAKATLNPGIYIIKGGGLKLSGDTRLSGTGVMIYLTGSDYNVNTGLPDSNDLNQSPPAVGGATFGGLKLEGSSRITLTPISNASSPFDGMGFYQRRLNTTTFKQTGYTTIAPFKGTIYAKWAQVELEGSSTYSAQFVVGSIRITGGTSITVDATGQNLTKVNQVFLVE